MPAKKERVSEVVDYAIIHGDEETCKIFGIQKSALDRYKRTYREHFGESADLLMKLKQRYSAEELKSLADGIRPKTIKNISYNFKGDIYKALILTDTHIGSKFTNIDRIYSAFEVGEQEEVDAAFHIGDVTEGMSGRESSIYELTHLGYKEQRDESIRILKNWKRKFYIISGNHDDFYNAKLGAGVHIVEDICNQLPDAEFLGEGSGELKLNPSGVRIGLFHGNDASSSYALSYRLQRLINGMSGGKKPNILLTGHDHKSFWMFYRNVHALACGCIQDQTPWMELKGLQAMPGFYIVTICLGDQEVKWFQHRFYPFYQ